MCLAKVYWNEETDHPVLTDVAYLKLDGKRIEIMTLLEESKTFQGKIKEIDFLSSKIIIEK